MFFCKNFTLSLFIFVVAALSDFFDGYIARKLNICSKFGAMLDPVADKILISMTYASFYYAEFTSLYLTTLVIGRDLLILFIVLICLISNVQMKFSPLLSSKINTTIQLIFAIALLTCKSVSINISLDMLEWVVSLSTVYSGIEYVIRYRWIKDELFK